MIDEDRDDGDLDGDYDGEHGESPLGMVMYEIVDEDNDSFEYEDSARVAYFIKIIVLQKIMHVTSKDSSYCDD